MTIAEALDRARGELAESCENPLLEAELLLAYHLKRERLYIHMHPEETMESGESFLAIIERRKYHEPFEYIVGLASFYDLYLQVAPGVLIPRPETEILIDQAAQIIQREKIGSIVEIGVGSGAISIVLARKFPHLQIVATDISNDALSIAGRNIENYGVGSQIRLVQTNLMDGIDFVPQMVVSNPPYIAADFHLEKNVLEYEPHIALFGGAIGDEILSQIAHECHSSGVKWLACEMGHDQRESMQSLFKEIGVKSLSFYEDFSKFDRGFVVSFDEKMSY